MKNSPIKIFALVIALVISSITTFATPIANHAVQKVQATDAFTSIIVGGPIEVIVKIGAVNSYKLEGDEEAISTLVAEVKGSTLIIRPQTSWKSWEKKYEGKKITAHVTATHIEALTMSGNGSLTVNGLISGANLALNLSGSGFIKLKSNTNNLAVALSGSGAIDIDGSADKADITLSGSANFNGKNFEVDHLASRLSGSGKINITANTKIKALISGSASIYYSGNAEVDKTVLLGSGTVKKI